MQTKLDQNFWNALVAIRHELHANPEVSGEEEQTANRIHTHLLAANPTKIITNLGGHGLLAIFDSGKAGPELLFRSELDALPIQEVNKLSYASQQEGVGHKCGHDGHSSILLGIAQCLHFNPINLGKVFLLFQPAEETGEGAQAVLADPRFENIQPDLVFALHNLPGYPMHSIVWRRGAITAAVKSMIIRLTGKTAHAAEPENGQNPASAIAQIIQAAQLLSNNDPSNPNFKLITPIHISLGEPAYGVSAGYGEVHFTIRAWSQDIFDALALELKNQVENISFEEKLSLEIEWLQEFYTNYNDEQALAHILKSAKESELPLIESPTPLKWGEDFGLFTQRFPGAFIGLGAGENTPSLHNPDYDFPDELLETGVELFDSIIHGQLRSS